MGRLLSFLLVAFLATGCTARSMRAGGIATTLGGGVLLTHDSDDDCGVSAGCLERETRTVGVTMLVAGALMIALGSAMSDDPPTKAEPDRVSRH